MKYCFCDFALDVHLFSAQNKTEKKKPYIPRCKEEGVSEGGGERIRGSLKRIIPTEGESYRDVKKKEKIQRFAICCRLS